MMGQPLSASDLCFLVRNGATLPKVKPLSTSVDQLRVCHYSRLLPSTYKAVEARITEEMKTQWTATTYTMVELMAHVEDEDRVREYMQASFLPDEELLFLRVRGQEPVSVPSSLVPRSRRSFRLLTILPTTLSPTQFPYTAPPSPARDGLPAGRRRASRASFAPALPTTDPAVTASLMQGREPQTRAFNSTAGQRLQCEILAAAYHHAPDVPNMCGSRLLFHLAHEISRSSAGPLMWAFSGALVALASLLPKDLEVLVSQTADGVHRYCTNVRSGKFPTLPRRLPLSHHPPTIPNRHTSRPASTTSTSRLLGATNPAPKRRSPYPSTCSLRCWNTRSTRGELSCLTASPCPTTR